MAAKTECDAMESLLAAGVSENGPFSELTADKPSYYGSDGQIIAADRRLPFPASVFHSDAS